MAVQALHKTRKLSNRIKHIKNTYFYKEVSKANTNLGIIHPTNILLKDRLYNYCFKFYKKIRTYDDNNLLVDDMRSYYYLLLVKSLKEKGFEIKDYDRAVIFKTNKFMVYKTILTSDVFDIEIKPNNIKQGLDISITNKLIEENNLQLGIVLDFPQLLTAEQIDTLNFNVEKYNIAIEKIYPYQHLIKGIHIWGKKKNPKGRWIAHCGNLDTFFNNNTVIKKIFINGKKNKSTFES